ncbi:P-loop containing nucleoside triphosphate hydrolase [Sesbania bispinosa]|nr:P-loop containing nucleoside triphosphate hydrolase [Sesbania bispinosa]
MADGFLFNIIEKLIGKLSSMIIESCNVRDDLEKLVDNMSGIKAVVLDAEEQQGTNHQVQLWLQKLKDALYDADDLLDDFYTEHLRRQVMTKDKKAKKVRIFFSSSNQFVFSFEMAQKIKQIRKRIEALNVDKRTFNFTTRTLNVVKQRETHSFTREEDVIGREEEKKELVELLLNTNVDVKENVSVISIIGIGGLGKTALAQLLYNDKAVQGHFELKIWVCVSHDFDVKTIATKIIGSKTNDVMDQVQLELRRRIEGRRYLLVLDDIWNENRENWLQLMTLLVDGAIGSKIIITTRSEKVAKISGTSSLFCLKGLDQEKSWKLFSQLAFENGQEPENQNLVSIGKEIVKKCSGVPLALRSIGGLMYSMETEMDWLNFKDKDIMKIDEQGGNVVLQLIKLSYDHLPFHLKKCFAFCSLLPKDCYINRTKLIQLWVAHGFVQSSNESICLEDVGNEYFMNLAHRSFFQELKRNPIDPDIMICKMHDLVHDLAVFVSGNDFVIANEKGQHIDKGTRHLSFSFPLVSSWKVPSSLLKASKLRTFLLPLHEGATIPCGELSLEESTCNLIMSSFEQLRVLDLNHLNSRKLPSHIGMLKHLRYLDLSYNKQIEVLPGSITKLNNLQTLLLKACSALRELPRDIWKLTSLRHLDLDGCCKLTFMPSGIGQLTNLQTLTLFVIDTTSKHSGRASELRELNNLRGKLMIKGLETLRHNPTEVNDVNLMQKSHLQWLGLTWDKQIDANNNDMEKDNIILEGLLSHHNIKGLSLSGFGGLAIPSLVNSFKNLIHISIIGCTRLQYLPQLHLLLYLRSIRLENLPCVEWIDNNSNNDSSSIFFPSLKHIYLKELLNLKGWCRCSEEGMLRGCCHQFKSLGSLIILSCPNLTSIPQHKDIIDVRLSNVSEKILQQVVNDSKVEILRMEGINDLKSMSGVLQHLTAVQELYITECKEFDPCKDEDGCYSMKWKELKNLKWLQFCRIPKMEYFPEGLQHVTTLTRLKIEDCANLVHISEWVTSLQVLKIIKCPKLMSLP